MNRVDLIGRITKDPEIQGTEGKEYVRFSLAVDRPLAKEGQQQVDFVNCVVFGQQAKFLAQYIKKGNLLALEGRLSVSNYKDKDGKSLSSTEVIGDRITNLTPKGGAKEKDAASSVKEKTEEADNIVEISDDDLPF